MGCCGSGQRVPNNKKKKAATPQPLQIPQKGISLKIAMQATAQAAASYAKKHPYFLQNQMM